MNRYFIVLLFLTQSNFLEANCVPFTDQHIANQYRISQIVLNVENIFNPEISGENGKFQNTTNHLHLKTKQHVLKQEIHFKVGDTIEARILEETERNLRAKHFIKDAEIKPIAKCDNGVTIKITTKDNWSLQPGISFGSSGGKSKYSFEIQEKNLFGLGKGLEFKYKKGIDREEKSIIYNDFNLFGSSKQLELEFQNNSDGKQKHFNLREPFVFLNTNKSWDIDYLKWDLINPIYESGEIANEFGQNLKRYSLYFGQLINNNDSNYHRMYYGYTSDNSQFFNSTDYPDSNLPDNRNYQYPWIAYEYINEDFIKRKNFKTMGRTEDISLGHHLYLKLGRSTDSSSHYDIEYSKGYFLNDSNLLNVRAHLNGILQNSLMLNSHINLSSNWHHFQSIDKSFFVSANIDLGQNLFEDQYQYLGGETGLRGFPFRYLRGENKLIITAEQRFFHHWYPLKTFQFATAIFVDSGTIWNNGEDKTLFTNVGVGFRLVPTRTSGGQVIHFDVAMPINNNDGIDNFQFQIKAKKSF